MEATTNSKAPVPIRIQFIPFHEMSLWDVKRYLGTQFRKDKEHITLETILTPFRERISHNFVIENNYKIISKINFGGNLFLRNFEEIKTYKGGLFLVPKNAIIFSKINARHGCIYFHQGNIPFAVSSEYPVYLVDIEKVNGEFLNQYLRSSKIKEYLNSRVTGISKARIKSDEFLSIPFPIKSLKVQEKLVTAYLSKYNEAERQEKESKEKEIQIHTYIHDELGIGREISESKKPIIFTKFSLIDRWAADYLFNQSSIKGITESSYPVQKVRNFLLSYQYGLSVKASKEPIGTPMLRMNNIINSELHADNLKYILIPQLQKKKVLLNKGDLLFNRTNSKELVGKTAVFELDGEFTFASYLIRLKLDPEKVNVHYINLLFNSPIGRAQIDMISRQVLGQANVNAQELQDFMFPIPNLKIQNKIVNEILKIKQTANLLKRKAETNRQIAVNEFEQSIF